MILIKWNTKYKTVYVREKQRIIISLTFLVSCYGPSFVVIQYSLCLGRVNAANSRQVSCAVRQFDACVWLLRTCMSKNHWTYTPCLADSSHSHDRDLNLHTAMVVVHWLLHARAISNAQNVFCSAARNTIHTRFRVTEPQDTTSVFKFINTNFSWYSDIYHAITDNNARTKLLMIVHLVY